MLAEINYWSVTFSARYDSDDLLLCRLCLAARALGVRFGSVNVFSILVPRNPDKPPVPPYAWFPGFDEEDALALLDLAGIGLEGVIFTEIPFGVPKTKKETTS